MGCIKYGEVNKQLLFLFLLLLQLMGFMFSVVDVPLILLPATGPSRGPFRSRECVLCVHVHPAIPSGHVLLHPLLAHLLGYAPLSPLAFSGPPAPHDPVVGVRCRVLLEGMNQPAGQVEEGNTRHLLAAWLASQAVGCGGEKRDGARVGSGSSISSNSNVCWSTS